MGDGAAMQCTFATEPCNVRTSEPAESFDTLSRTRGAHYVGQQFSKSHTSKASTHARVHCSTALAPFANGIRKYNRGAFLSFLFSLFVSVRSIIMVCIIKSPPLQVFRAT